MTTSRHRGRSPLSAALHRRRQVRSDEYAKVVGLDEVAPAFVTLANCMIYCTLRDRRSSRLAWPWIQCTHTQPILAPRSLALRELVAASGVEPWPLGLSGAHRTVSRGWKCP